jgi:O-antigen/teichoic acid export membrane protein
VTWAVIQQVGGQSAAFLAFVGLALLLRPEEIGVVAMANAWLGIIGAFAEAGLGAALIQREDLAPDHAHSAFVLNIGTGVALAMLGLLLSWPAAVFFHSSEVLPVMAVLSTGFVIRSFGLTQVALLQRRLDFKTLAVRDTLASAIGGVAGIALALAGAGVWSYVGMSLTVALTSVVLVWRSVDWRPRIGEFSRRRALELWGYGSKVLGFSLLKAFSQNTDRLILGHLLGPAAVGVYALAFRVVLFPVTSLASAISTHFFPHVSRIQADPDAVRREYTRYLRIILSLVLPLALAAALAGGPLIGMIFGSRWEVAARLVPWLALVGVAWAVFAPFGQLLKGLNRPGGLILWSAIYTVVTSAALLLGGARGLEGAASAFAVANLLLVPVMYWLGKVWVGVTPSGRISLWIPLLAATGGMAAVLGLARIALTRANGLHVGIGLAAGAIVYLVLLVRFAPELDPRGTVAARGQR